MLLVGNDWSNVCRDGAGQCGGKSNYPVTSSWLVILSEYLFVLDASRLGRLSIVFPAGLLSAL